MSFTLRNPPDLTLEGGGDFAVDIDHANDSIRFGDGTNLLGPLTNYDTTKYAMPIDIAVDSVGLALDATLTSGDMLTQLTDALGNIGEFDDVGGEKALKVSIISTVGGGGEGASATDGASFTADVSIGAPIMGVYDANESDTVADGDLAMIGITSTRHLKVSDSASQTLLTDIEAAVDGLEALLTTIDADTGSISTSTGSIDTKMSTLIGHVDGLEGQLTTITGHVDGLEGLLTTIDADTGAMAVDLAAIEVLLTTQNGHVDGIEALLTTIDADTSAMVTALQLIDNAISGNEMQVDVITLPALPAGTNNIGDVDIASALPAGDNNIGNVDVVTMPTTTVQGAAAHDVAISGNPVPVGMRAQNANPTLVGNGDVCYPAVDLAGRQITTPVAPRELCGRQGTTITSSTSETTIVTATASVYHDLTCLIMTNSSDTDVTVTIREDTGASALFTVFLSAGGGAVIPFPVPLAQGATNDNWTAQCSGSVDSVRIFATFVTRN